MDWNRFKMLTRWLTFMTFLAGSANSRSADSGRRALTVVPTCRVKGQPESELILNCGDGKHEGGVQFWHTPFGDLQPSAQHSQLDSVFVHHNGTLVIPVPSLLHSGLYYCVLQHSEGSTLWSYELRVGHNQNTDDKHEQNSHAAHRTRRTVRLGNEEVVSDRVFAGAVVASVLVTFVVGFSAGALARSYILRCWHAVTTRLRSPKRRRRQADVLDHSSQVVITTFPPMHESHTFETEWTRDGSPTRGSESRTSVTSQSPPAKPKRSFRNKEEMGDTAYLEGCDYMKEEERMEEAGGGVGATEGGSDEEETTQSVFYLEDEELKSETDEDKSIDDEEEEEAAGEQEERSEKEVRGENEGEKAEEVEETECCEELHKTSAAAERGENKEEEEEEEEEEASAPRRRIIRVYQYDEEGQRYCHLPDPGPDGPEPAPRLKQRSLSLTRLNAIMAAAAEGPMEAREGEERSHFHMEI